MYTNRLYLSTIKSRELPASIKLTQNAANRIATMLQGKEGALGVKVSVKKRGCNGYSYIMNYAMKDEDYKRFEEVKSKGVSVFVDPKAVFFIVGTEMDFVETSLSSEFTFTNPNSKGECGCGESFNI